MMNRKEKICLYQHSYEEYVNMDIFGIKNKYKIYELINNNIN